MERASGDFVRSLREEIEFRKKIKNYERNLLSDSLDHIVSVLKENPSFKLVSLKNFKTNELSSIANISTEGKNALQQIEIFLNQKNLICKFQKADHNLSVCTLDLSGKIQGYREKQNLIVVQFLHKISGVVEIKIFLKSETPVFSVYENNYFFIKLWVFDSVGFQFHKIDIKNEDRDKFETNYPIDENLDLRLAFHETGEVSQINILVKKGEK